jgi:hypothetical protein
MRPDVTRASEMPLDVHSLMQHPRDPHLVVIKPIESYVASDHEAT